MYADNPKAMMEKSNCTPLRAISGPEGQRVSWTMMKVLIWFLLLLPSPQSYKKTPLVIVGEFAEDRRTISELARKGTAQSQYKGGERNKIPRRLGGGLFIN